MVEVPITHIVPMPKESPHDLPPDLRGIEWLSPWEATEPGLETELEREVGRGHTLSGVRAVAVGRRVDNDDVLFWLPQGPAQLAVVHLTWTGRRERSPQWPATTLYASVAEWRERCMVPDHNEVSEDRS